MSIQTIEFAAGVSIFTALHPVKIEAMHEVASTALPKVSESTMPGARKTSTTASNAPDGVKDAFAAWLKQLEGDDAPDKVLAALQPRRRHISRAERNAQIDHAQQSTTASAQKRSIVVEAVNATITQCKENSSRLPPIDRVAVKLASAQRRHQALVDQASYAALSSSYTSDMSPGLNFLVRLTDSVVLGYVGARAKAAVEPNETNTSGKIIVCEYELRKFPVQIVPTLLRIRQSTHQSSQSSQRRWFMALLACRDLNDVDDGEGPTTSIRSIPNSLSGKLSSKPARECALHIRVYMLKSQPKKASNDSLSCDCRRELVRALLSSWVSMSGGGVFGSGVRAVHKRKQRACVNGSFSSTNNSVVRLLRSVEEVEDAADALCSEFNSPNTRHRKPQVGGSDPSLDNNAEHNDASQLGIVIETIQPYIPSRSTLHSGTNNKTFAAERSAWIARCSFRKKESNSSTVWILSGGGEPATSLNGNNPEVSLVVDEQSDSCQIVKCTSSQSWTEPRLLTASLAPELERILKMSFREIVVDMIQGTDGSWWLLQVKAFEIRHQEGPPLRHDDPGTRRTKSAPEKLGGSYVGSTMKYRKWRCAGRYCTAIHSEPPSDLSMLSMEDSATEPSGYLSLKVVRSCEFVDNYYCRRDVSLGGGFESFSSALAFHLQHELPKKEARQLYESQPLCSSCMRRYYQLREQLDQTQLSESKRESALGTSKVSSTTKPTRQNASMGNLQLTKPRLLPTLQPAIDQDTTSSSKPIYTSASAPALMDSPRGTQHSRGDYTTHKSPSAANYAEQLAAMDKLLEIQTSDDETTKNVANPRSSNPVCDDVYARIFSPTDQQRRVDAMWQSIAPKSLDFDLNQKSMNQSYNNFSVADELRRVREESSNDHAVLARVAKEALGCSNPPLLPTPTKKIHQIRLTDCRILFSDEALKDRLVKDATDAICQRGEKVCFVVIPEGSSVESDGLPGIALRSLLLDVKDALAALGRVLSSTPQIVHEASGCITMTVE